MNTYVASLSMYDWPEVRDEVDALWSAIGARLSDAGVDAPDALTRTDRFDDLWTHPGLLVGQACGLNVAEGLRGRVEVLGALDYGVEGCEPGDYRSVLVCRPRWPRPAASSTSATRPAPTATRSASSPEAGRTWRRSTPWLGTWP